MPGHTRIACGDQAVIENVSCAAYFFGSGYIPLQNKLLFGAGLTVFAIVVFLYDRATDRSDEGRPRPGRGAALSAPGYTYENPHSSTSPAAGQAGPKNVKDQDGSEHPDPGLISIVAVSEAPECVRGSAALAFAAFVDEWKLEAILSVDDLVREIEGQFMTPAKTGGAAVLVGRDPKGKVVATVTLDPQDMVDRPELGPWLASLVVAPEHRRCGLGGRMVSGIGSFAAGSPFSPLKARCIGRESSWMSTTPCGLQYPGRNS